MTDLQELLNAERKAAFIADYFGVPELHEKRRMALIDALEAHFSANREGE